MNKFFLRRTITPILAIILCCLLYLSGNFQMIIAALILIVASAVEYNKDLFGSLGFQRKNFNAKNLLVLAPICAITIFLFYPYVMLPCVTYITGQPIDLTVFDVFTGNLPETLKMLVFVWISAAFAEEIVFRGYLMQQFTKFFGSSTLSLVLNILLFGIVFGFLHAYQGLTGQILSAITGMILALIFHIRKCDLWFIIAVHGFVDTVAFIYFYYGWM